MASMPILKAKLISHSSVVLCEQGFLVNTLDENEPEKKLLKYLSTLNEKLQIRN